MKLTWEKVASVTTGGKSYFYVAFPEIDGKRRKLTVCWDRNYRQWAVLYDDYISLVPIELGFCKTSHLGRSYAELRLDTL